MPSTVRAALEQLSTSALGVQLAEGGSPKLIEMIAELRNRLSHGRELPAHEELVDWIPPIDAVAQISLLRRLGIADSIISDLAQDPHPESPVDLGDKS